MTSKLSLSQWLPRAALFAAALTACVGCSLGPSGTEGSREAPQSTRAALENPTVGTVPRYRHAGVELDGGRALVCGGTDEKGAYPANCELLALDGNSSLTRIMDPLPLPGTPARGRLSATLTLLPTGGVLLAGGRPGRDSLELGASTALIPQAGNNWSLDWQSDEEMKVARDQHTTTLLGSNVVVIGGYTRVGTTRVVGEIEFRNAAGGTWSLSGASEPRLGHTTTLLKPDSDGARVLVLGGFSSILGAYAARTGFTFSFENGIKYIEEIPPPTPARDGHTATLLDDGSVLVVGGETTDGECLSDAWLYNPSKDSWAPAGAGSVTKLVPRRFHSAVRVGSRVIVAGGEGPNKPQLPNGDTLSSVQVYDPKSNTWTDLRPLTEAREYFQLLKLSEDRLVASGGWQRNRPALLANSELITVSALGAAQSDSGTCVSGHAADGYCCESACNGPCEKCDSAGTCQPVSGTPESGHPSCGGALLCKKGTCLAKCDSTRDCVSGYFCDAQKDCTALLDFGGRCDTASQCANGAPCVDGVCCRSECSGSCEACTSAGECRVLDADEKPLPSHPQCSSAGDGNPQCAAHCDGKTRAHCVFPDTKSACSEASCQNDRATPAGTCDGQGTCQAMESKSCGAYACNKDGNQCSVMCDGDQDCVSDAHCEGRTCWRCKVDECSGFQCDRDADECLHTCQKSATDCVGGYYCHPLQHRCVQAVLFPASELPSCALGRSRGGYHSLAMAAAAWLLFSARRRRLNHRLRRGSNGGGGAALGP